jgi:hypothetical protein
MTLRTGKGSAGGMYRYYTCSTKARQGERGCRGLTISSTAPSSITWSGGCSDPARLTTMMDQLLERREEWNEHRRGHIAELCKRAAKPRRS